MATPRQATVTTRATPLWANETGDQLLLVNRSLTTIVYVGDDTVSPDTGMPIPPLGSVNVTADHQWWGITTAGSAAMWAAPGAANYTPSPAETAAQIAASPVPVEGAAAGQTVASGATANVVVNATNGSTTPLTVTVVAGSAKTIELHELQVPITFFGGSTGSVRLIRSDSGADLMVPVNGGNNSTTEVDKDFNGARLPPFVAVQVVLTTTGLGNSTSAGVDLNYALIG